MPIKSIALCFMLISLFAQQNTTQFTEHQQESIAIGNMLSRQECEEMIFSAFQSLDEYAKVNIVFDINSKQYLNSKLTTAENVMVYLNTTIKNNIFTTLDKNAELKDFGYMFSTTKCETGKYFKQNKNLTISCILPDRYSLDGLNCNINMQKMPTLNVKYDRQIVKQTFFFVDELGGYISDSQALTLYEEAIRNAILAIESHELELQEAKKRRQEEEYEKAEKLKILKHQKAEEEKEKIKQEQQRKILEQCISSCSSKQGIAKNICINDCKRLNK